MSSERSINYIVSFIFIANIIFDIAEIDHFAIFG